MLLICRWGWSIGRGGLTERCGTLHCGICTRSVIEFWCIFLCRVWISSLFLLHDYIVDQWSATLRGIDLLPWLVWFFLALLQSHHRPRTGPFELNDVFAIINAAPAIALLSYGFSNKGLIPGLCFGAVSISSSRPRRFCCLQVKSPVLVPVTWRELSAPPNFVFWSGWILTSAWHVSLNIYLLNYISFLMVSLCFLNSFLFGTKNRV